jgi:hypothetical protein
MNNKLTHIICVLDKVHASAATQEAAVNGYNQFISTLRDVTDPCDVTLVTFEGERAQENYLAPLANVPMMKLTDYTTRNKTALLDAIGFAVTDTGRNLDRLTDEDKPARVACLIMTDGHETGSRTYTHQHLADMIQEQSQKYDWEFVYIGGTADSVRFAQSLNIPFDSTLVYSPTNAGVTNAFAAAALYMNTLRMSDPGTMKPSFTNEDRLLAIGQVTASSAAAAAAAAAADAAAAATTTPLAVK